MRRRMTLAGSLCLLAFAAHSQELSPGKYAGGYTGQTPDVQYQVILDIKTVENGKVQGEGARFGTKNNIKIQRGCVGSFPLTGTVKGDSIDLRSAEKFGGSGDDCQFRIRGTVQGSKILGKIGQNEIELSK